MKKTKRQKVLEVDFGSSCDNVVVEQLAELSHEQLDQLAHPHTHPYYVILWYKKEGGTCTIDFQEFPIQSNSLFFVTPGQVHSFQGTKDSQGYIIKIRPDFSNKITTDNDGIRGLLFKSFTESPFATIPAEHTDKIEEMIRHIQDEQLRSNAENHDEMLQLLVRVLMIQIRRYAQNSGITISEPKHPANALFTKFQAMVEEEFIQTHQVSEYANKLGVSVKTLGNAVRISTGHTPLTIINERVILEAKRMLRYSDLRVKEVAYKLGFDDPSNFVKFFRHYTGCLPSEFQKTLR